MRGRNIVGIPQISTARVAGSHRQRNEDALSDKFIPTFAAYSGDELPGSEEHHRWIAKFSNAISFGKDHLIVFDNGNRKPRHLPIAKCFVDVIIKSSQR